MIDGFVTGLCTRIQQNTDLRLELFPDRIKQPSVRVDLFRVFLLKHKDKLNRDLSSQLECLD